MRIAPLVLLVSALAQPLCAASWPSLPKDVWAMKDNAEQVAQGAVVLERKLDFQPYYFEETLRVRILSQAGVAAAEFSDLPGALLSLEGRVSFPDGSSKAITKREDLLVRKVVSTIDGTINEGVLIPSGVTPDCVVEVRWREATMRGRAKQTGVNLQDAGSLPERCGDFWFWTLASAYPTQTCIIRKAKEVFWPMALLSTKGCDIQEGSDSQGNTYTLRNLPGLPSVPFGRERYQVSPKVLFYRPVGSLAYLTSNTPSSVYWQKAIELYYKDWFLKYVSKGGNYKAFSLDLRKDLTGGPRDKARLIAQRVAQRTVNLDDLLFDEKPDALARSQVQMLGVANLDYTAKTGYADYSGMTKLLFHVLADEGLKPVVALVSSKHRWLVNPEVRTPYQLSHVLLGVDEPGQSTLWLDPSGRVTPAGEVPVRYQGTRAVVIDTSDWQVAFRELPVAQGKDNARTFTYQIDATEEVGQVHLEATYAGAPALSARSVLGERAPTQREAWFKEKLERNGLTVTKVSVANGLDLTKPLGYSADGTVTLEGGRLLKLLPFPGLDSSLYLPPTLPEQRQDIILMPHRIMEEAVSTIHVPKGYVLPGPIENVHANRWGTVTLRVHQEDGTNDLKAAMSIKASAFTDDSRGYPALKDYLEWMRAAIYPVITLEKRGAPRP